MSASAKFPVKTHSDCSDPLAAQLAVQAAAESAKPVSDRARLPRRQQPKLAADAHVQQLPEDISRRYPLARRAEQKRHRHREPRVGKTHRERDHPRGESRNLVHDDDPRPHPAPINHTCLAFMRERIFTKPLKMHIQALMKKAVGNKKTAAAATDSIHAAFATNNCNCN